MASKQDLNENGAKTFAGKYELASSENFDVFLKEIGVGMLYRKLANTVSQYGAYPVLDIRHDNENSQITARATIPFWSQTNSFTIGKEFDEVRMDGKTCKSIIEHIGGNQFVQTQRDGSLSIKYLYQFEPNHLQVTAIANNVQCLRVYKRLH